MNASPGTSPGRQAQWLREIEPEEAAREEGADDLPILPATHAPARAGHLSLKPGQCREFLTGSQEIYVT